MKITKKHKNVLKAAVDGWYQNFGGTDASRIAEQLGITHAEALKCAEELCETGLCTLNRNQELFQVSIRPNDASGFHFEPLTTHIIFPSKSVLRDEFYSSNLPEMGIAEYLARLYLGANQIDLVFFSEDVLSRYLNFPEIYQTDDSLAGGYILSKESAPEDRTVSVRYGKSKVRSGQIVITVIYKDLAVMSPQEQRYWHAHEIIEPEHDTADPMFGRFLSRTYGGYFVEFPNPIAELVDELKQINLLLGEPDLFTRLENVHLHLPAEQNFKSFCDAASELYKVVGPDGISQKKIKDLLSKEWSITGSMLVHAESGRPLSTVQLFSLAEEKFGITGAFTMPLKQLSNFRTEADHKILPIGGEIRSYSRDFADLCAAIKSGLKVFKQALAERREK